MGVGRLWEKGLLKKPMQVKANSGPYQFAGRTTLNSGSATVTVSTAAVEADSIIVATVEAATSVSSGGAKPIEVKSISAGNFFTLGTADGVALARQTTIMWTLLRS